MTLRPAWVLLLSLLIPIASSPAAPTIKDAVELANAKSAAISPDGKTIVTAGRTVELWDAATGKSQGKLEYTGRDIYQIAFSKDGSMLAVGGSFMDTVSVFDLAAKKPIAALKAKGSITAIGFTPDGRSVITGGAGAIHLHSLPDGAVSKSIPIGANIETFLLSADGNAVFTLGKFDGKLAAWDLRTGAASARQFKQERDSTPPMGGNLSPAGPDRIAIAAFMGQAVYLFNARTGEFERKLGELSLQRAGFSADGKSFAYGNWEMQKENFVVVADAQTGKPRLKIGPFKPGDVFAAALLSADGKTLVAVPNEGRAPVLLWKLP